MTTLAFETAESQLDEARNNLELLTEQARAADAQFQSRKDICSCKEFAELSAASEQAVSRLQRAKTEYEHAEMEFNQERTLQEQLALAKERLERRGRLNSEISKLTDEINRMFAQFKTLPNEMEILSGKRNLLLAELSRLGGNE